MQTLDDRPPYRATLGRVQLQVEYFPRGCVVTYRGAPADLVALGVCTPAMLAAAPRGRLRVTGDGYRFSRRPPDRRGRQSVTLDVPADIAEQLPGVPRTWRSTVLPLLRLTDDDRQRFSAPDDR